MRDRILGIAATASVLSLAPMADVKAQRVTADIHIAGWPVAGTIRIGDYPSPARRVVVVREAPRVIVVQKDRGRGWHRRAGGMRVVEAWYDGYCGVYFDRYRRGLVRVLLVERDGRYYRYDRRFDGRIDDRYDRYERYDRYDRRYDPGDDDGWEHDHRH